MPKKKKQLIGYKYYLGVHSAICHGPVDHVSHIYYGDDVAWSGFFDGTTPPITNPRAGDNGPSSLQSVASRIFGLLFQIAAFFRRDPVEVSGNRLYINEPNLFGGDEKEGGIVGFMSMIRGDLPERNPYLVSQLGEANVSAYYGVLSLVAEKMYVSTSPYLKGMTPVVHRIGWQAPGIPQWYSERAYIPWNWDTGAGGGYYEPPPPAVPAVEMPDNYYFLLIYNGALRHSELAPAMLNVINSIRTLATDLMKKRITDDGPFGSSVFAFATGGYLSQGEAGVTSSTREHTVYNIGAGDGIGSGVWGNILAHPISTGSNNNFFIPDVVAAISGRAGMQRVSILNLEATALDPAGLTARDGDTITPYLNDLKGKFGVNAGTTVRVHRININHFHARADGTEIIQDRITDFTRKLMDDYWGKDRSTYEEYDGYRRDIPAPQPTVHMRPSTTGNDMNPAHIMRECLTNKLWGLGAPEVSVDNASFTYAADLLFNEGFGISLRWNQEDEVRQFMQTVCDHANATCYVSPKTGLWKFRPIRGDYNIATIPTLTEEDDLVEVEELVRRLPNEMINSITIKYHDLDRDDYQSRTFHNIAAIQALGQINATTLTFDGILRHDLAQRVAERELLQLGYPLLTGTIIVDRKHHYMEPGDVFILDAPRHGAYSEVMRVLDVDYGTDTDHKIALNITQDIFALEPQATIPPVMPEAPLLVPPPAMVSLRQVQEASYYIMAQEFVGTEFENELEDDPDLGMILAVAPAPLSALQFADVVVAFADTDVYESLGQLPFAPAVRSPDIIPADPDYTEILADVVWRIDEFVVGELAMLGTEYVRIDAIDLETNTVTIGRGCLDTVPARHDPGTILFSLQNRAVVTDEFTAGNELDIKLLSNNGRAAYDIALQPADRLVMSSRAIRPLPPGNFRINGEYAPIASQERFRGLLTLTWAHRNRVTQTAEYIYDFTEEGITSEVGVTYQVVITGYLTNGEAIDPPLLSVDVGSDTEYVVDVDALVLPVRCVSVRIEVKSFRDGYECFTAPSVFYVLRLSAAALDALVVGWYDVNTLTDLRQFANGDDPVIDSDQPVGRVRNQKGTFV